MALAFDYTNCNLRQEKFINYEGGIMTIHCIQDTDPKIINI